MSTNSGSGLWHLEFAEIGPILGILQKQGVTLAHMARLRDVQNDPEYAQLVAEAFKRGTISPSQDMAKIALGTNYFGPNEWAQYLFTNLSASCRAKLSFFPWNDAVLDGPCPFTPGKKVRDTHVAFAGLPSFGGHGCEVREMSIWGMEDLLLQVEMKFPVIFPVFVSPSHWYDKLSFYRQTLAMRWYLIFVGRMPDYLEGETYDGQVGALPEEYEVPLVVEQTAAYVLMTLRGGLLQLFYEGGVICSDPADETGSHACIDFRGGHIDFSSRDIKSDEDFSQTLSGRIGASRKLPA